jgi:sulfide:quinone oxidoreductase
MKTIAIVGGGSGGVSAANHLAYKLKSEIKDGKVKLLLIEGSTRHYYQPGFLEIVFDLMTQQSTYKNEKRVLADGVTLIQEFATKIDLENRSIATEKQKIPYDYLVIATGASYDYGAVPGLKEGTQNFYSLDAAVELKNALNHFKSGKIIVGISSMPYKCTPAPLEAVFLLNDYFAKRGIRDKVEIEYMYPMPMTFPDKGISDITLKMFQEKGIKSNLGFQLKSVDNEKHELVDMNGKRSSFDLAIIVPPHRGNKLIENSGFGDKMGWVSVDPLTLNIKGHENAYAIGDSTNLQVSKAGSVADAEAVVVSSRIIQSINGEDPVAVYDGSGGALMITGMGSASMITSSYTQKPVFMPESYSFYWIKLIYNNLYWNMTAKPVLNGVVQ